MEVIKEVLLLSRDKFTGWWLLKVCDMPTVATHFAEAVRQEMSLRNNE